MGARGLAPTRPDRDARPPGLRFVAQGQFVEPVEGFLVGSRPRTAVALDLATPQTGAEVPRRATDVEEAESQASAGFVETPVVLTVVSELPVAEGETTGDPGRCSVGESAVTRGG